MTTETTRFEFGKNWRLFLDSINEDRIELARTSFVEMLGTADLSGQRFLDIGSGSGLSSLVARRLGAEVYAFDYDAESVACTSELRRRYFPEDPSWHIEQGSILDSDYLATLGQHDIVYSWGVLHHTGDQWTAIDNAAALTAPGGYLFLALYNDQGRGSRMWKKIKRAYCTLPRGLRWIVLWPSAVRLRALTFTRDLLRGRPLHSIRAYKRQRGMSVWRDIVDWVGGYPFEVSKPEEVLDRLRPLGFEFLKLKTCAGGHGCNEFVFRRAAK